MRHEVVHAYTWGPGGQRGAPRLLGEGMAEYLRFLEPRDSGFAVPTARFRDHLARLEWLFARYERMGLDFREVDPARLVRLKPWEF